MIKFTRFLTLMVCLSFFFGVKAETINNYLEKFDNLDKNGCPTNWSRIQDSYDDEATGYSYEVEYVHAKTGGQDGACLNVGSQKKGIYDENFMSQSERMLNDFLITPSVGGNVSFYLKSNVPDDFLSFEYVNVKVFICTKKADNFIVSKTLLKEIKSAEITDAWGQFTIPNVPEGTYLALQLSNVGIDDFAASTADIPVSKKIYLEKFDNLSKLYTPVSWSRIVDSQMGVDGCEYSATYYHKTSGGQDGAYLKNAGQEETIWDENYEYELQTLYFNDYLVTPAIGGEVTFYLKKDYASSVSNVKVFKCTKSAGSFDVEAKPIKEFADAEITTSWKQFTIPAVAEGTYLALRLDNVNIDEFTAESAEVEKVISMAMSEVKLISGMSPKTGSDNKFEVSFDVKIKNTGNTDLTPGMENYSLTLYRKENGKQVDFAVVPVEQYVKVGAESDYIRVSAKIDAGSATSKYEYNVRENMNNTILKSSGKNVTSKPYIPEMKLQQGDGQTIITSDYTLDFGVQKQELTKNFYIQNTGFAPLNVTELVLPEGFTTTLKLPTVIDYNKKVAVPVTFVAKNAGTFSGKIKVVAEKVVAQEFNVTAVGVDPLAWFEDFESGKQATNMLFDGAWSIIKTPLKYNTPTNVYILENYTSDLAKLVSPLLNVKTGKTLSFKAAQTADFGERALNVYYSADRKNWTLVREIKSSEFSQSKVPGAYSDYQFSQYTIDNIPEGKWYIALEGSKVRLDDLLGYELVAVEHDLMINSTKFPSLATVNQTSNAEINLKNLLKTESAGSYSIKLYLGDEVVAEAEPVDFPVGDKNFVVAFTPHKSGKLSAYFEVKAGDVVIKSEESVITVSDEFPGDKIVMEAGNKGTGYYAPIALGNEFSETETVYTADKLGLEVGTMISALSYDGYCKKTVARTFNIKIYLQNTTDVAPNVNAPADIAAMTLVFQGDVEFTEKGSSSNPVEMIFAKLNLPFEYTGDNLRVFVHSESAASSDGYFLVDKSVNNACIHRENGVSLDFAHWGTTTMPLVNIFTEKEVPTLSGLVASAKYGPLPNVKVKLVSGDVLYFAYTNAEGFYSIPVIQSEKDYKAIIDELPGYVPYEHKELINLSAGSKVVNFTVDNLSGVEALEAATLAVYGAKGSIVVKANAAQVVNVYNVAGRLVRSLNVEEGTTTIEGVMAGFYIVNGTKVVVR